MFYYNYYGPEYLLVILALIITLGAQFYINSKYKKTRKIMTKKGLKGFEVARKILDKNGLKDVKVEETQGILSDHYDPRGKVVRLSSGIYGRSTVASAAVAAHECGHAIQDKNKYTFLRLRNTIIPIVNLSSTAGYIAIVIGIIAKAAGIIMIGIVFELIILLFQIITLPVEFNASRRGLEQLKDLKLLEADELKAGKSMLNAAALTYVASVASTLLQIARLLLLINRNKR